MFVVPIGVLAAAGLGVVVADAAAAAFALAGVLVLVAAARWLTRREPREGLAVRSWPVDVLVSVALAVSIAVLAVSPGV